MFPQKGRFFSFVLCYLFLKGNDPSSVVDINACLPNLTKLFQSCKYLVRKFDCTIVKIIRFKSILFKVPENIYTILLNLLTL